MGITLGYSLQDYAQYALDSSGNVTGLVGVGGDISLLGYDAITVGSGGRFTTLQSAVDYISTLEHFTAYTPPNAPSSVSAWAQNTSIATTGSFNGAGIEIGTWFKLADDVYAYPLQGFDASTPGMVSGIKRIESTLAATSKAITYYRPKVYTVLLLDAEFLESVTIDANVNIEFISLRGTVLRSAATGAGFLNKGANFRYGLLRFGYGCRLVSDNTGAVMYGSGAGSTWTTANAVQLEFVNGAKMESYSADSLSPDVFIGSLKAVGAQFLQVPIISNSHFLHVKAGGDVLLLNNTLEIGSNKIASFLAPDARFMDKVTGRKVVVDGLKVSINDPQARLSDVYVAAGLDVAACEYHVSNVTANISNTCSTNIYIVHEGSTSAPTANNVYLFNNRINGLKSSGTKKNYHAQAGSAIAVYASMCSGGTIDTPSAGSKTVDNAFAT